MSRPVAGQSIMMEADADTHYAALTMHLDDCIACEPTRDSLCAIGVVLEISWLRCEAQAERITA